MASTRTQRRDAHRRAILSGAAEGFAVRGYRATQIVDIARAAGVAHGTVYRHFENKLDLFRAVVRSVVDEVLDATCGDELERVTQQTLHALGPVRGTLGPEAREVTAEEFARLEQGLEEVAARFLDDPMRCRLWRACVLEAARGPVEPGAASTITALFAPGDPAKTSESKERASGWR